MVKLFFVFSLDFGQKKQSRSFCSPHNFRLIDRRQPDQIPTSFDGRELAFASLLDRVGPMLFPKNRRRWSDTVWGLFGGSLWIYFIKSKVCCTSTAVVLFILCAERLER